MNRLFSKRSGESSNFKIPNKYMPEEKGQQQFFMRRALELGEKGRFTAPPNPWVGCVIVNKGKIVGEGFHRRVGYPHAEIEALQAAGTLARDSTVYVTLEPCCHLGRTPPCTYSLIRARVKKIIIPFLDPDSHVRGKGISELRHAGIEVQEECCQDEALKSLEPYLFHRKHLRPFCVLKVASSLDGRIAAQDGTSQWITGEEARRDAHQLRAASQAILIGKGTVLADNPRLTVRGFEKENFIPPLRVFLDSKGEVTPNGHLFDVNLGKTLVYTTSFCPQLRIQQWRDSGIDVEIVEEEEKNVSISEVLKNLGKRGVVQLLIEGGAKIHHSFLSRGYAEKVILYQGGCLLGTEGKSVFGFPSPLSIDRAPRWKLESATALGNDVKLVYQPT
jgi:diaminohydroxyphosphoribosylaminopyrimidine deaminase/5-amino-6-(5-phosphoribosylamino)uracil reductase